MLSVGAEKERGEPRKGRLRKVAEEAAEGEGLDASLETTRSRLSLGILR